jgi:hypothetical protein
VGNLVPHADSNIEVSAEGKVMTSATYYTQREAAERNLADSAADPKVRDIHLAMAQMYAELAAQKYASPAHVASSEVHAA